MTNDDDQDQPQAPEGRMSAFSDGATGGGIGTSIASSLPRVAQVDPKFDPAGSVLDAANRWSGVGNGSSNATLKVSDPYGQSMKAQLKSSGSGTPPEED